MPARHVGIAASISNKPDAIKGRTGDRRQPEPRAPEIKSLDYLFKRYDSSNARGRGLPLLDLSTPKRTQPSRTGKPSRTPPDLKVACPNLPSISSNQQIIKFWLRSKTNLTLSPSSFQKLKDALDNGHCDYRYHPADCPIGKTVF